ncbi:MAG: bifunctional glutamate N-acetyltransferase/amino-acid acetyltransferase ArgJ [Candidatus Omnitrophica bacterium]|nr:bifunctional glutamate N-acetyltransferase/amino-acid acetyltransferase ArgJ [Candidatus Omnitrophota bacterium]MDE2221979.1 bifunctional glutamate N-acetyltransferase/amino-acid acetyltransferase ArgJ [Candidatus Omnitrophota bacterium]
MKIIKGGITAPKGFLANGLSAGIKRSGKPDLGVIVSEVPAVVAGVFTKNSIKAAPLIVSMEHIKKGIGRAVLVNSGNANCYTGETGLKYAYGSTQMASQLLGVKPEDVLVTSTGIIGKTLPYNKIIDALPALIKGLSRTGGVKFARAIMTTDLKLKECAVEITLGGKKVIVAGCAKGSGMIEPNMATMLGFITTDAAISLKMLKLSLKRVTERSFNSITVDGCMSTNDMLTIQASGLAGNKKIVSEGADFKKFYEALEYVCIDLAKKIVIDGEGATKFITIRAKGAVDEIQARKIAKTIANSALVKTAAFGSNPNWGRVAAAVGSLGLGTINERSMKISFSPFDKKEISITVELPLGRAEATVYTCDLSYEYVRINGEYN